MEICRLLDQQYLETPFYGSRWMTVWLQKQGFCVNRKRVHWYSRKVLSWRVSNTLEVEFCVEALELRARAY